MNITARARAALDRRGATVAKAGLAIMAVLAITAMVAYQFGAVHVASTCGTVSGIVLIIASIVAYLTHESTSVPVGGPEN